MSRTKFDTLADDLTDPFDIVIYNKETGVFYLSRGNDIYELKITDMDRYDLRDISESPDFKSV